MRNYLIDILGLSGFGAMTYGLYLRFGLADALIVSGALLMVAGLASARANKRRGYSEGGLVKGGHK